MKSVIAVAIWGLACLAAADTRSPGDDYGGGTGGGTPYFPGGNVFNTNANAYVPQVGVYGSVSTGQVAVFLDSTGRKIGARSVSNQYAMAAITNEAVARIAGDATNAAALVATSALDRAWAAAHLTNSAPTLSVADARRLIQTDTNAWVTVADGTATLWRVTSTNVTLRVGFGTNNFKFDGNNTTLPGPQTVTATVANGTTSYVFTAAGSFAFGTHWTLSKRQTEPEWMLNWSGGGAGTVPFAGTYPDIGSGLTFTNITIGYSGSVTITNASIYTPVITGTPLATGIDLQDMLRTNGNGSALTGITVGQVSGALNKAGDTFDPGAEFSWTSGGGLYQNQLMLWGEDVPVEHSTYSLFGVPTRGFLGAIWTQGTADEEYMQNWYLPPMTNASENGDYTFASQAYVDSKAPTVSFAGGWKNPSFYYLDVRDRYRTTITNSVVTNQDYTYGVCSVSSYMDKEMLLAWPHGFPTGAVYDGWACANPEIATIDQSGVATMVSNGVATISVVVEGVSQSLRVPFNFSGPTATTSIKLGTVAGSLRETATTNIDSRIAGGTSVWSQAVWSTLNHATTQYVRNAACWAKDADLSGVVVSTAGGNPRWHGTLLTTQHIAMARHAYDGVGSVKRFVGRSGVIYTRTITAIRDPSPGSASLLGCDTVFGKLDSPLPTNDVAVYPVLPASYIDYAPADLVDMPALIYDQNQQAHVGNLNGYSGVLRPDFLSQRDQFYSVPYIGDSGRPVFLWTRQGLVFLFTFTYPTSGSSPVAWRSEMNTALAIDGAALTDADLSSYTEF